MDRRQPPEEIFGVLTGPPLELPLQCNQCGTLETHQFEYALVHHELDQCRADGWDGILLSRIVECSKCGAVDDYQLSPSAHRTIMRSVAGLPAGDEGEASAAPGRVKSGISVLFDGTVVRRPSQAIAHLRALVEERPGSAEAWRRLGNARRRFGAPDEAADAFKKAVELDPEELEASHSLALLAAARGQSLDAFVHLCDTLGRLTKNHVLEGKQRLALTDGLVELLREIVEVSNEPMALLAGWAGAMVEGQQIVNVSTVDLRKLTDVGWERLPRLLANPKLAAAELTPALPEDEPTVLQCLLERDSGGPLEFDPLGAAAVPIVSGPRVGPNVPCPCGSGKKHKRCCGR